MLYMCFISIIYCFEEKLPLLKVYYIQKNYIYITSVVSLNGRYNSMHKYIQIHKYPWYECYIYKHLYYPLYIRN